MHKIFSLIDLLIPSGLKETERILHKTRLFILVLFLSLISVCVSHLLYYIGASQTFFNHYIGYLYSILPLGVLWYFKELTLTVNVFTAIIIVNLNYTLMASGGIGSPPTPWLCIVPTELSPNSKEDFKEIEINEVLEIVKSNLNEQIKENRAEIIYNDLPQIYGMPIPIIQLFQNLITNAIKFRREGIHPKINISSEECEGYWKFRVKDNGIGIKKEDCSRIFEEFTKLNKRSKFDGHGIGLATCQKIVKQHKGEIGLESLIDRGSCFYFTLLKKDIESVPNG